MSLKRRGISVMVISSLVLLGLVVAYFLVDFRVRMYAQDRVEQEIAANLPDTVTGDVTASIGGLSVIAQYLSGRFERVVLSAPGLAVNGVPASVHVVATDVPVDQTTPVGAVRATVDLAPGSLNALAHAAGTAGDTELKLGDGEVSYAGTLALPGLPVGYIATAKPTVDPAHIILTPSGAKLTTDSGSLDLGGIVRLILGSQPLTVCVAQFLPDGVDLTGVSVTPERARLVLESSTLLLNKKSLTTLGSCPAG
ncbi:MAG TPA: DUF2993 domain-containing protein [Cryobacterium sp.]|nr:DUF2993 domain-containing protein [Cryobacterium sp.]